MRECVHGATQAKITILIRLSLLANNNSNGCGLPRQLWGISAFNFRVRLIDLLCLTPDNFTHQLEVL